MGRQVGVIKLNGSVGEITFYKSEGRYLARKKSGLTGNKIRVDPAFARTRENMAEFGRAGRAGKLLRTALRAHLDPFRGLRLNNRLLQAFARVIKADAASARGDRNVAAGDVRLLRGFEFNENRRLGQSLLVAFGHSIDRATGTFTVTLEEFVPDSMISSAPEATHCKLITVGLAIDFANGTWVGATVESDTIRLNDDLVGPIVLSGKLPAGGADPLFLLLGISYYQELNGDLYLLKNGSQNAMVIVDSVMS